MTRIRYTWTAAERWLGRNPAVFTLILLGFTCLFVTHNVREAARLTDRVVLLSSRPGRVEGRA